VRDHQPKSLRLDTVFVSKVMPSVDQDQYLC